MRVLLPLLLIACATPPPANVVGFTVSAEKAPCVGVEAQLCLLVLRDGASDEELFYDVIDGWEHTWGEEAMIRVDEQEVHDPPEDGSSLRWTHLATTRTTPRLPGDSFRWSVDFWRGAFLEVTGDSGGALLDGKAFSCEQAVCTALDAAVQAGDTESVSFEYADPIDDPLIVTGVGE